MYTRVKSDLQNPRLVSIISPTTPDHPDIEQEHWTQLIQMNTDWMHEHYKASTYNTCVFASK